MAGSIDPRGLSPGVIKAARWFSRILWFGMTLAVIASAGYGCSKNDELEKLRQDNRELREEKRDLEKRLKKLDQASPSAGNEEQASGE